MDPQFLVAPVVALLLHRYVPLHRRWDWIAGAGATLLTLAVMPHVVSPDNDLSLIKRFGFVAAASSLPFIQIWGLVAVLRLILSHASETATDALRSARETEARWFRRDP